MECVVVEAVNAAACRCLQRAKTQAPRSILCSAKPQLFRLVVAFSTVVLCQIWCFPPKCQQRDPVTHAHAHEIRPTVFIKSRTLVAPGSRERNAPSCITFPEAGCFSLGFGVSGSTTDSAVKNGRSAMSKTSHNYSTSIRHPSDLQFSEKLVQAVSNRARFALQNAS